VVLGERGVSSGGSGRYGLPYVETCLVVNVVQRCVTRWGLVRLIGWCGRRGGRWVVTAGGTAGGTFSDSPHKTIIIIIPFNPSKL